MIRFHRYGNNMQSKYDIKQEIAVIFTVRCHTFYFADMTFWFHVIHTVNLFCFPFPSLGGGQSIRQKKKKKKEKKERRNGGREGGREGGKGREEERKKQKGK